MIYCVRLSFCGPFVPNLEEKLGYNVELKGPGALTLDGFFALTGCTSPSDPTDHGCGDPVDRVTDVHINVEVWTSFYQLVWDELQRKYPDRAPRNLGNMGYYGSTAFYVPSGVQERAYDAEGINLDFYRDYNSSRENPGRHFANPGDINVSYLLPCTETALMLNEAGPCGLGGVSVMIQEYLCFSYSFSYQNSWVGVLSKPITGGDEQLLGPHR